MKDKQLHDTDNHAIKDIPLSPLPIYSYLSEGGKYNSGFSFVIEPNDLPKLEDESSLIHVILHNPAGHTLIDGSEHEKIEVPIYFKTPFKRVKVDGTYTISSPLPVSSIDQTGLCLPNPLLTDNQALVMKVPANTQARVSHVWWNAQEPSNLFETWIATNKKVDNIGHIRYRNLGNYTSPCFRHRVFLESINYLNEKSTAPKQIVITNPQTYQTHKFASWLFSVGTTTQAGIFSPDVNLDKMAGEDVVLPAGSVMARKWSDIEPSGVYNNKAGALNILKVLGDGYDFVVDAVGKDVKPIVLTSYFEGRNYLKDYIADDRNRQTTFYKINLPSGQGSPVLEIKNYELKIKNEEEQRANTGEVQIYPSASSVSSASNSIPELLQDLPVDIREMLLGDQTSHTSQTCQTNQTMLAPPIGREVWRLFVNGEQMDEWNQDKLLQGYACALLDYYNPYFKNNKQSYFPSCPINRETDETTAFLNGFCIWFSSTLKGTTSVQVGDTVYDLAADPSSNNLKGADNEGAIAAALYQLHIPKGILKAALTPGDTGTSAFGIIRLANELSGLGYDVEGTFQRYGL
ncbi:hypothetical protein KKE26_05630, partial [bacterium]|nr:hypothetical protein [bacterium]